MLKGFLLIFLSITGLCYAHSGLWTRAIPVDGLLWRLNEIRHANEPPEGYLELSEHFAEYGVVVPEGGFITYNKKTGHLVAKLKKEDLETITAVIEKVYRSEHFTEICRAYYNMLMPLNDKERLQKVLLYGFPPDPLVANIRFRINAIRNTVDIPYEPLDLQSNEKAKKPRSLTKQQQETIKDLEEKIIRLLEISLNSLTKQLALISKPTKQDGQ